MSIQIVQSGPRQGSLAFACLPVQGNEKYEFKPSILTLKIDLVLYPAHCGGVG